MISVIHILIILVTAWVVYKKYGMEYPRIFWLVFLFKMVMGSSLGLIYLYYYTANDTWLFFQDAGTLAEFGKGDIAAYLNFLFTDQAPDLLFVQLINSQERSLFLIKILSVFSWVSNHNYWVCAAYFSLISFLASWYLFSIVVRSFENSWMSASLAFLFFPSIVFWSSGLIKETLALTGIYFLAGFVLKMTRQQKLVWFEWVLALAGFWVAWTLKYYWAALFGAVSVTYLIVFFTEKKYALIQNHKIIGWLVIFVFLCGAASLSHPNFYLSRFLEVLITNHNDFVMISEDHGLIHFYDFHADWGSVILNSPWALFSGLLRPFVWEATGLMSLLASVENLVIVILLTAALSSAGKISSHRLLLFSVVVYIIILCIFLALSTPNLGTLSRYRVGFLPFLIFIISYRNPLLDYLSDRIRVPQP